MQNKQNQNKIFIIGFVLIALVVIWSLSRPAILKLYQKSDKSEEKINEEILKAPLITPKDLYEKIKNKENLLLIDLRSADEFEKGHLATALNFLADTLNSQKTSFLQTEKTSSIVLINQGDDVYETARKTNELVSAGYVNAKYLQGGIRAWQIEGYTLISGGKSPVDEGKVKKISVEKLAEDLASGQDVVQFVDLRSQENFQTGHIPSAINIPFSGLEKDQGNISSVKKVVVYGNSDEEANRASATLFDLNFFNVYVLEGGLDAWKNANGKVEQ